MPPLFRIFFVGLSISFLGSLPLGTLNIAAMQIAITDGYKLAMEFAVGMLLAEVLYVRISLVAMDRIRKHEKILKALEWITVIIIVALAISSFVAAGKENAESKNVILSSGVPRFLLGLLMSALNPVQIPFWFGWSTLLFTKKVLMPINSHYNIYIVGIGIGTFLGTCVFILGGKLLVDKLNANQNMLNYIVGSIFALTALIQLYKIWSKKDAVEKVHTTTDEDVEVLKPNPN